MNSLKTVAVAAVLSTTAFGGAYAADAITTPPPPAAEVPVFDEAGFDWNGFYAGAKLGGQAMAGEDDLTDDDDVNFTLGGTVGYNAAFDYFLVGAEADLDAVFEGDNGDDTYGYGSVLARGGVVVTDNLLAYGALGYGSDFDAENGPGDHVLAGGGLELAVTDSVSVDGRYLYGFSTDDTEVGNTDIHKFTIGANFHF